MNARKQLVDIRRRIAGVKLMEPRDEAPKSVENVADSRQHPPQHSLGLSRYSSTTNRFAEEFKQKKDAFVENAVVLIYAARKYGLDVEVLGCYVSRIIGHLSLRLRVSHQLALQI